MDKPLTYLACPYTHPREEVRLERFQIANRAAGILTARGLVVFSPISHSHPIALAHAPPTHWEFWEAIDRAYLSVCSQMYVLAIDGWQESRGVNAELRIAAEFEIPVTLIDHDAEVLL